MLPDELYIYNAFSLDDRLRFTVLAVQKDGTFPLVPALLLLDKSVQKDGMFPLVPALLLFDRLRFTVLAVRKDGIVPLVPALPIFENVQCYSAKVEELICEFSI